MRPGTAIPFRQPWYVPISCTPLDTGMPMGGIGNSFTLTPAGTTPVVSLLNGLHLTPPPEDTLRLRNLFFAERELHAPLMIVNIAGLLSINRHQPLRRPEGRNWLEGTETLEQARGAIAEMSAHAMLYQENEEALDRWHVALSDRTRHLLRQGPSGELSIALLLDVFGSTLTLRNRFMGSLTGDIGEQDIAGQPAYPSGSMRYTGLYPSYRTDYESGRHALGVRINGFSPVIRDDERACSLPVSVTEIELENGTSGPLEATLAWTLENLGGDQVIKMRPGVQDAWFRLVKTASFQQGEAFRKPIGDKRAAMGMHLSQSVNGTGGDFEGAMALAVETEPAESGFHASVHPSFYAVDETRIVEEALRTGRVTPWHMDINRSGRERRMGAICVTVLVPPGTRRTVSFAMVLDFPHIRLNGFSGEKKYTGHFPDSPDRALAIAAEALVKRGYYRERIAEDHASLDEAGGPFSLLKTAPSEAAASRFKTLLCNNLAFLADATVWDTKDHFWIRECADYPFFNSLDVYFYGSFSLLRLLPRLDGCILREFAAAILSEDPAPRRHWEYSSHPYADLPDPRHEGPRGVTGAVPHDMGSPFDPRPDAYTWHNVKHWKDLAPKFLLMVWRHYRLSGDRTILIDCWPASVSALNYLSAMRSPGEAIPLTSGTDDTFDNLASLGVSIYCGSLWIAALTVGAAIARELGETGAAEAWEALAIPARLELTSSLWDEKDGAYRFYKEPGSEAACDHLFADQMLADLWLDMLGLEGITAGENRKRALTSILKMNFRKNSPWIGAVNLGTKDGRTLESFQAQDVWVGVQYSLAAACLRAGETTGAWELVEAQHRNLYEEARIPFGAPEGFNGSKPITADDLKVEPEITGSTATAWLDALQKAGFLDMAHRLTADTRIVLPEFIGRLEACSAGIPGDRRLVAERIHGLLQGHGLQYTAGRYLRPGMAWIFAWPFPEQSAMARPTA